MKKILTHIAIHVKDIEASKKFYSDWCGMDEVHSRDSGVTWMASPGNEDLFVVVLMPGNKVSTPQNKRDYSHLGFSLETKGDLLKLFKKATDAGIVTWGLETNPPPVGTYFGVNDPDGNMIEFSVGQPLGKDFKNNNGVPQP